MLRTFIIALALFGFGAGAEFQGRILTYQQLLQLPVQKRAMYIQGVRNLVLDLERQQLEKEKLFPKEYSAWIKDLQDFAGQFQVLPEVHAKLSDGSDKKRIYMPSRSARLTPDVTNSAPLATDSSVGDRIPEGGDPLKEPITPPGGLTPDPAAREPSCQIPTTLECEGLSKFDRDEGIKRFRSDTSFNTCISGGNFSEYPGGRKVPGGCAIITSWGGKTCPGGQAMCNPVIFGAMKYGADNQPQNFQLVCVPRSSRGQFDITNRCGQCPMNSGWEKIKDPEDFVTLFKKSKVKDGKLGDEFLKSWNELRRALASNFKERCLQPAGKYFRAAFCQECKTLGRRISEMNVAVLKSACAGNIEEAHQRGVKPHGSGESGSATREPASRKVH